MNTIRLEQLGVAIKEKRGNRGIREVAKEIGVSPATLSRIETGRQPDLDTFSKICAWLKVNPAEVLSLDDEHKSHNASKDEPLFSKSLSVQFRAEKTLSPETAKRLGEMIIAVQRMTDDE